MIQGRFVPAGGFRPEEYLSAARRVLQQAQADADELGRNTRNQLARSFRSLRNRQRRFSNGQLEKKLKALEITFLLESERKYRELVKQAHRDCLDIALSIARELVGDEFKKSPKTLARKIDAALENLLVARPFKISVAPGSLKSLPALLKERGVALPIITDQMLPEGIVRIHTHTGVATLSWSGEVEEIAQKLKSVLESKLAGERS